MTRFFVTDRQWQASTPILEGDNLAHARVLRLKPGEKLLLCNGEGQEALCRILSAVMDLEVLERRNCETEARVAVSVYMALPKGDKLEHVIQKATELGAREIVTFPTARCVSRPDDKSMKKKLDRWQKIAASAAEQSGRGVIPRVVVLGSYREALLRGSAADMPIVFYENEQATTLHQALEEGAFSSVAILSGPEGGFEEKEIDMAREAGFRICTLGKRILRCETAPLCGLSAVMYAAGEF